MSLGSSGVVEFTRVRPGGRWVHLQSLGPWHSPWKSLGSLGVALRVVGFMRGRWVHSGSPWGSFGSSWVVEFTRIRFEYRWLHPEPLGSLLFALVLVGFIRCRWVHSDSYQVGSLGSSAFVGFTSVRLGGRLVRRRSLGSLGVALSAIGFI